MAKHVMLCGHCVLCHPAEAGLGLVCALAKELVYSPNPVFPDQGIDRRDDPCIYDEERVEVLLRQAGHWKESDTNATD